MTNEQLAAIAALQKAEWPAGFSATRKARSFASLSNSWNLCCYQESNPERCLTASAELSTNGMVFPGLADIWTTSASACRCAAPTPAPSYVWCVFQPGLCDYRATVPCVGHHACPSLSLCLGTLACCLLLRCTCKCPWLPVVWFSPLLTPPDLLSFVPSQCCGLCPSCSV